MSALDDIQYSEGMNAICTDVSFLISKLECGKSAGSDGVYAETIKFSHCRIRLLLSLFSTLCLSHGYLPPPPHCYDRNNYCTHCLKKCGNNTDTNNYKPVLLLKCEYYLTTSANQ